MEVSLFSTLLCRFMVGGVILSGSTYLANFCNPLLAGILVTIPLELVSLFYIKEDKLYAYARSILIMSIATVIPVLYFNIIHPFRLMSYNDEIISSFLIWLIIGISLFYFMPQKMYFYKD